MAATQGLTQDRTRSRVQRFKIFLAKRLASTSTSGSASSIIIGNFSTCGRIWSATARHCVLAAGRFLGEGGGDESGDDAAAVLAGIGQHVLIK